MSVTLEKVKELRNRTQAGFADCKKALEECADDIEKAIAWLREKGISKAAKKASAVAAEGQTKVVVKDDVCAILEVNSQTDFVAKNDDFIKFVNDIADALIANKSAENVNNMKLSNGKTVDENSIELTAKIGEKIGFRRAVVIVKSANQTFGIYQHSDNRKSAVVLIDGNVSDEVAKDVAMHLTAMNPKFLNSSEIDNEWLETERKILVQKTIEEGKPAEFAEKIVAGRMKKITSEVCLVEQDFFKDPSLTVGAYVKNNKGEIVKMIRYEVGEGIEKVVTDFAAEVQAQMKK